ncbi:unnamed protein product [Bathycoccus prasinos]
MRSKIRWFTDSANHTTYRISLRSSSLREPRHPLLRVISVNTSFSSLRKRRGDKKGKLHTRKFIGVGWIIFNDPSAGSPTETLLRLSFPLNDKVQRNFPRHLDGEPSESHSPNASPDHSIGRERRAVCTKGRDVINASDDLRLLGIPR